MILIKQKIIKREDVRANPHLLYVFGDNVARVGYGGQAAEIRGEPNSQGIVTKYIPATDERAYFYEGDKEAIKRIEDDLEILVSRIYQYKGLVIPSAGIGTGLAKLDWHAPTAFELIKNFFDQFEADHNG